MEQCERRGRAARAPRLAKRQEQNPHRDAVVRERAEVVRLHVAQEAADDEQRGDEGGDEAEGERRRFVGGDRLGGLGRLNMLAAVSVGSAR